MPSAQRLPFKKIFLLPSKPSSGCPFLEVEETREGYLARCRVLDRYLTKYAVARCERYWESCPFRRIGAASMG